MLNAGRLSATLVWMVLGCLTACVETPKPENPPSALGELRASLAIPMELQEVIRSVRFEVVDDAEVAQVSVVPVDPTSPGFEGEGLAGHGAASWYVTVNPGRYLVRATPLDKDSKPSMVCGMATGFATVSSGETTALTLVSNCRVPGSGGLDITLRVNQGPFISDLSFLDGTRICAGESAEFNLEVADADGDSLEVMWQVTDFPSKADMADVCLAGSPAKAAFSSIVPGRYGLEVMVSDGGDTAMLNFGIDVVDCGARPTCPGAAVEVSPTDIRFGRCDCAAPFCGNGVVESGEACDPPDTEACNSDCSRMGDVRPAFASAPPRVESLTLQSADAIYDGKTARMTVQVAKEDVARVGRALSFYGEGRRVFTLFDEEAAVGNVRDDGRYTGKVQVSAASLDKVAAQRTAAASRRSAEPVFSGRELSHSTGALESPTTADMATGEAFEFSAKGFALTDPERTLMITDLSVVEDPTRTFDLCTGAGDPDGAWTFKTLMTAMANTPATNITPEDFVRHWLEQFSSANTIANGEVTEARTDMEDIIAEWEQLSGVGPGGTLDLNIAPFRLTAIVNRIDLGTNLGYGGTPGEGRFIFSFFRPSDPCSTMRFTVILEYALPLNHCDQVQNYACQWIALDSLPFPSAAYNDALQQLTDVFTTAGANPDQLPNRSAISQIRTNDNALGQDGWEFREFKLEKPQQANPGMLHHVGLALQPRHETPDLIPHQFTENHSLDLSSFVTNNAPDILAEVHTVPLLWPGTKPFQAVSATYETTNFFEGPSPSQFTIPDNEARHKFSLNTCTGCHARETDTPFTHVSMRPHGAQASLSGFLTGITVTDPTDQVTTRDFEDLVRRNQRLDAICTESCSLQFRMGPTPKVH